MSSDRSVLSVPRSSAGPSSISASIVRIRVDFAPTGVWYVWQVLWDDDTPFDFRLEHPTFQ